MKILIELPDTAFDQARTDAHWQIAKAVLDAVEPGASTHCVQWPQGILGHHVVHPRLGVEIRALKSYEGVMRVHHHWPLDPECRQCDDLRRPGHP